jgi:hypothetical protein
VSADLPPLPAELRSLIADELDAPAGDDDARRAIHARVIATLGVAVVASGAATASAATGGAATTTSVLAGLTGKIVAIAVTVGAIGGGAAVIAHERSSAPVASIATRSAPAVPTMRAIEQHPDPAPPTVDPPATPAAPRRAPVVRSAQPIPAPEIDQSALLARALAALDRGKPAAALELVERDAADHRAGALVEEREAIRVDALRRLGRTSDASAAARAFLAQFPHSLHRGMVSRALEESP